MRKLILMFFVVMVLIVPISVFAATYGGEFESADNDPNGNKYTLVWVYDDTSKTLSVEGMGKIPELSTSSCPWKDYVSTIEKVIIEDGVTSIGKTSFANHTALKTVEIANSVTNIEMRAFERCLALERVVVPSNVKNVGDKAFYYCTSLKEAIFEEGSTKSLGGLMFGACTSLEKVYVYGSNPTIKRKRSNQTDSVWFREITDFSKLTVYCVEGSDADDYFTNDIYTITNWSEDAEGNESTQTFAKETNYMTAGNYTLKVEYITDTN